MKIKLKLKEQLMVIKTIAEKINNNPYKKLIQFILKLTQVTNIT